LSKGGGVNNMTNYIYHGMFKQGDKVRLLRDLIVNEDTGSLFRNPFGNKAIFNKGAIFTIAKGAVFNIAVVSYSITDGEHRIGDVPEWFLELA
jgi:hypothetical protein